MAIFNRWMLSKWQMVHGHVWILLILPWAPWNIDSLWYHQDVPIVSQLYSHQMVMIIVFPLIFHSKATILCWQCILLIEPPHHIPSLPKAQNNSQLPLKARAKRKEGEMNQQKHCVNAMKNCERMCWNNNTISGLTVYFTTQNMHVISNNNII